MTLSFKSFRLDYHSCHSHSRKRVTWKESQIFWSIANQKQRRPPSPSSLHRALLPLNIELDTSIHFEFSKPSEGQTGSVGSITQHERTCTWELPSNRNITKKQTHGDKLSGSGNKKRLTPKNIAMIRIPAFLKATNKSCFIDLQQSHKNNTIK